jgi:hypothetical protein
VYFKYKEKQHNDQTYFYQLPSKGYIIFSMSQPPNYGFMFETIFDNAEIFKIPRKHFTPIFAMARSSGWVAHWHEQVRHNRIFRPTQIYTGAGATESKTPRTMLCLSCVATSLKPKCVVFSIRNLYIIISGRYRSSGTF